MATSNDNQKDVEFTALTVGDRLAMARDALRNYEANAYRAFLTRIATPHDDTTYTADEDKSIRALQAEVSKLEKELDKAQS